MDDIRALIAAGKKIEAIKQYRERTGADLAQAKLAIDSGL
jgi:ribosomal protein L7/L12